MDKFDDAIELFKMGARMSLRYQERPIVVTYSGGKDSDVLVEVALASGMPFEVYNSHTTVDAPQTVYHIRNRFKQLEEKGIKCTIGHGEFKGQRATMWYLIEQKIMPPTRRVRYCCSVLKESGCEGRVIATGVRWEESAQRRTRKEIEAITSKKANKVGFNRKEEAEQLSFINDGEIMLQNDNDDRRKVIEHCQLKNKIAVNPIIGLKDKDIWEITDWLNIEKNPLYEMGYDRVGCIGCPLARTCQRKKEFDDFPKYKEAYIRAFDRMLKERKRRGIETTKWKTGEEVFAWWMNEETTAGQLWFDEDGELHEGIKI